MNKRSYRRFTTDEKRMILTEVQQPGVTLSEVCRKHSVSPALVYRWRAVAVALHVNPDSHPLSRL